MWDMVCSLTADTFIARYKKRLLVYFVPHQTPQLPDHPPLVEAQTFTMYLLLPDLAFLPLLYLRRPRSSLVPPHSVYRRPKPASLFITTFELHTFSAAEPALSRCCQPPHLACVPVLPSPVSKLLLLSHIHPLRCAGCLGPYFIIRRLSLAFLQAFPASRQEK